MDRRIPPFRRLVPPLALALCSAGGGLAFARGTDSPGLPGGRGPDVALRGDSGTATPQAGMSLDAAIAMVEQRFGARVVRADTQQSDGQTIYVLRLLNAEGRVWTVRVNAATGAVQ